MNHDHRQMTFSARAEEANKNGVESAIKSGEEFVENSSAITTDLLLSSSCDEDDESCIFSLLKTAVVSGNLAAVQHLLLKNHNHQQHLTTETKSFFPKLLAIAVESLNKLPSSSSSAEEAELLSSSSTYFVSSFFYHGKTAVTADFSLDRQRRLEILHRLLIIATSSSSPSADNNPLCCLNRLATAVDVDAAEKVISTSYYDAVLHLLYQYLPVNWLDALCCEQGTMTPLLSSLLFAFCNYNNDCLKPSQLRLSRLFKKAVIPLLSLGAELAFGPGDTSITGGFWSVYDLFALGAPLNADLNTLTAATTTKDCNCDWICRIIVATMRTSAFSNRRLQTAVDDFLLQPPSLFAMSPSPSLGDVATNNNVATTADKRREIYLQMVKIAQAKFPLNLQEICRIAILRRLPKGYRRLSAIDSLGHQLLLPHVLTNFLKFSDLLSCDHGH